MVRDLPKVDDVNVNATSIFEGHNKNRPVEVGTRSGHTSQCHSTDFRTVQGILGQQSGCGQLMGASFGTVSRLLFDTGKATPGLE